MVKWIVCNKTDLNLTKLCTYAKLNCLKFNSMLNDPERVDMP